MSNDDVSDGDEPIEAELVEGELVEGESGGAGGSEALDDPLTAALGGGGLDLGSMMQMAQDMSARMGEAQQELMDTAVEGTAGGGLVTVTLNGHLHLRGIHIDPGAFDGEDPTMVEDLVQAAWADAHDQVARLQAAADPLGGLGGALGGGLGGLLGGGG